MLLIFFLLSLAAAALAVWQAGFAFWQGALLFVGCFAALNILYALFWVAVAQTVDDTKPIDRQRPIYRRGIASISNWLCSWTRVRAAVKGTEKLPKEGRFVLVCNHRSGFDPVVTAAKLKDFNLCFISKPSNLKLPYIGKLAFGAGFLPIDRENDREALKTILTAADYLKKGFCSIVIYPEGTRSKTDEMLPFHAGSFKIAQKAGVPLAIAAIRGSERVKKNFPLRPTRVELCILELLPAEQVKAMKTPELSAYSREKIEAFLAGEGQEAAT